MSDFDTLAKIFGTYDPFKLISDNLAASSSVDAAAISELQKILLNYEGTADSSTKIGKKINALINNNTLNFFDTMKKFNQFHKNFTFYSRPGTIFGLKHNTDFSNYEATQDYLKNLLSATDSSKQACVVASRSPYLSNTLRNSADIEIFMNGIPPLVMSRCVPYLSLEYVFERTTDEEKLNTPSLYKFLYGGANIGSLGEFDKSVISATSSSNNVDKKRVAKTYAGMELFTSPQTLLNMDKSSVNANRFNSVKDLTKPLATLETVKISLKGTYGVMQHKTASVSLKIHDKSRLSDFADLIQPTSYGRATIWLTYGWKHPGVSQNDPYAEFINKKLITREAYAIVNSSFSFSGNESVSVSLSLATKSFFQVQRQLIADTAGFIAIKKDREELSAKISNFSKQLGLDKIEAKSKEIRPFVLLGNAASNVADPSLKYADLIKDLNALKTALDKNSTKYQKDKVKNLDKAVREFYLKGNKVAFAEASKTNATSHIAVQIDKLKSESDPFLVNSDKNDKYKPLYGSDYPYFSLLEKEKRGIGSPQKGAPNIVSLGYLYSALMLPNILSLDDVTDVQTFFYNINGLAGFASNTNLAEFPIDLKLFKENYIEYATSQGTVNMTIEQLFQFIANTQIQDLKAIPYGFRGSPNLFKKKKSGESGRTEVENRQAANFETLALQVNNNKGSFRMPVVEVYVETLYAAGAGNDLIDNAPFDKDRKKILRIHIYDKTYVPVKTENDEEIKGKLNNTSVKYDDVVGFVSRLSPKITPYTSISNVKSVSVQTSDDQMLASAQMIGHNKNRGVKANADGTGTNKMPLRVIPTTMSMTTLGCPLLNIAQLFYIDTKTGTTIDNVYGITSVDHDFQPGSFNTSLSLVPIDAYGQYESINLDDSVQAPDTTQ